MQEVLEPEVIFPDAGPGVRIKRVPLNPIVLGLKIALTGLVALFVVLVVMICFPISALCTFSTVLTSSTRLAITHLWAWARGKRPSD